MNYKKIFLILLASILLINTSFSYNISDYDRKILNKVYYKIDKFDIEKLNLLENKVKILTKKYRNNERLNFLLIKINNYILNKLEYNSDKKTDKNIITNEFKVLKIIDWDTIIIDYFWKKENIRFIWIDAPENSKIRKGFIECYGKESKQYLFDLLSNKKVSLEFDKSQWKRDKYDRLLAYIIIDWKNVNNLIIKNGFAFEYTYNKPYKYLNLFKKSQKEAQNKKIWIWSLKTCKLDYINIEKKVYIPRKDINWKICDIKWNISYKTKKKLYHLKTCPWYKKTKINLDSGEKWFCSEEEAIKSWWIKAWNCN